MISISEVQEQNLSLSCEIMKESAEWLIQRRMPLWKVEDLTPEFMGGHVARKELFLATVDNEGAGTIILQETDELFWPEVNDGKSLFFHKLAVRRKFAGSGVSKALMDYAYLVAKSRGKTFLRMDCSARHPPLRLFYENNGFQFLDQKHAGPWWVDRLFKPVALSPTCNPT